MATIQQLLARAPKNFRTLTMAETGVPEYVDQTEDQSAQYDSLRQYLAGMGAIEMGNELSYEQTANMRRDTRGQIGAGATSAEAARHVYGPGSRQVVQTPDGPVSYWVRDDGQALAMDASGVHQAGTHISQADAGSDFFGTLKGAMSLPAVRFASALSGLNGLGAFGGAGDIPYGAGDALVNNPAVFGDAGISSPGDLSNATTSFQNPVDGYNTPTGNSLSDFNQVDTTFQNPVDGYNNPVDDPTFDNPVDGYNTPPTPPTPPPGGSSPPWSITPRNVLGGVSALNFLQGMTRKNPSTTPPTAPTSSLYTGNQTPMSPLAAGAAGTRSINRYAGDPNRYAMNPSVNFFNDPGTASHDVGPLARLARGGMPRTNGPLSMASDAAMQGLQVGPGSGQDDQIDARLSDGEYVIDAATVADLGDGSTAAGARKLDIARQKIRAHKRAAPTSKIPPKAKPLEHYLGMR